MEKCFIVTNNDFLEKIKRYKEIRKSRTEFINKFFDENGIESEMYCFDGSGISNEPCSEFRKDSIRLFIEDTQVNREKYGLQLKKGSINGMLCFRKKSEILKKFKIACIDSGVVLNLEKIRPGDYFQELRMGGYSHQQFEYKNKMYLRINTDAYGNKTITPIEDGFSEIKTSAYYIALEKYEQENAD